MIAHDNNSLFKNQHISSVVDKYKGHTFTVMKTNYQFIKKYSSLAIKQNKNNPNVIKPLHSMTTLPTQLPIQ